MDYFAAVKLYLVGIDSPGKWIGMSRPEAGRVVRPASVPWEWARSTPYCLLVLNPRDIITVIYYSVQK
jgi:hypothetical protein